MNIMKRSLFVLLTLILSLILNACGSTDEASEDGNDRTDSGGKNELRVAYPAQPPVLDPHISTVIATTDIIGHVFETLLTVDENSKVIPLLAETYEQSEDGKSITFNLKKGVKFHNGKEMVAEDVVSSMERWKKGLGARNQFDDVTFKEVDEYTVVAELPEPSATALFIMSHGGSGFAAIMPKEIIDSASETGVSEYIGTGPFEFIDWQQDQHITLERVTDYHGETTGIENTEALVERIKFFFTPDSSTQVAGIQAGEYDVAFEVPFDNADMLADNENLQNMFYPDAYLLVHLNKKHGLFKDQKARQAMSAALDVEEILIGAFTDEEYFTLNHNIMMTHQVKQWESDVGKDRYNQHNPEKAKQLLDEAGYNGEEITILTDREYEEHYKASLVVQSQLEKLGMKVKIEAYDWPTATEKRADETGYEIYIMGNVVVPEPSSTVYLMDDYAGWTDSPELDVLLEEFRTQPSIEDAKDLYDDLMEWFYDYVPVVKVGDYNSIITTTKEIDGVKHQNRLMLMDVTKQ